VRVWGRVHGQDAVRYTITPRRSRIAPNVGGVYSPQAYGFSLGSVWRMVLSSRPQSSRLKSLSTRMRDDPATLTTTPCPDHTAQSQSSSKCRFARGKNCAAGDFGNVLRYTHNCAPIDDQLRSRGNEVASVFIAYLVSADLTQTLRSASRGSTPTRSVQRRRSSRWVAGTNAKHRIQSIHVCDRRSLLTSHEHQADHLNLEAR